MLLSTAPKRIKDLGFWGLGDNLALSLAWAIWVPMRAFSIAKGFLREVFTGTLGLKANPKSLNQNT